MQQMFDNGKRYSRKNVIELRRQACLPVRRPPVDKQQKLVECPWFWPLPRAPYPAWLPPVCRARDVFDGQVMQVRIGEQPWPIYQVLFAKQSPFSCTLVRLKESSPAPSLRNARAPNRQQFLTSHRHNFRSLRGTFVRYSEVPDGTLDTYYVLPMTVSSLSFDVFADTGWGSFG